MSFVEMEFVNKFKGNPETNLLMKHKKFSAPLPSIPVSLVSHSKFSKHLKQSNNYFLNITIPRSH